MRLLFSQGIKLMDFTLLPLILFLVGFFGLASIGVVAVMATGMADDAVYKTHKPKGKVHRQMKRREIARYLRRYGHCQVRQPVRCFIRKHKMMIHLGCLIGIACCLIGELMLGGHFRVADWTFLVLALACEVS